MRASLQNIYYKKSGEMFEQSTSNLGGEFGNSYTPSIAASGKKCVDGGIG